MKDSSQKKKKPAKGWLAPGRKTRPKKKADFKNPKAFRRNALRNQKTMGARPRAALTGGGHR